ncbi:MAG: TolC family protein [Acidaminococcaceae bacterium]
MITYKKSKQVLLAAMIMGIFSAQTAWAAPVELTLNSAISMALATNPTIKMSEADRMVAKAQKDEAKSSQWITVGIEHNYSRGGTYDIRNNYDVREGHSNGVKIGLPIYTGGKISGMIEQAVKGYEYAQYGESASYQNVKLVATTGYYDVLKTSNLVTLAKESVNRLEEHLKNVQAQYEVGVVAKVDVLRSEVELADAQQTLIKAENAYNLAMASLNNVIGLPLSTELSISDALAYNAYDNTLDNCLTFAMANRPEIYQAKASVEAANAGVQVANAGYMPQVTAGASNGWKDSAWPGFENKEWGVSVVASMNVFDSGVTAARVQQARGNRYKAEEAYRQTTDNVQLDVRNSYLNLKEAEKRISTSYVAVAKAEEDYHIAQVRYQAGVGTNTDVIDAQVALTQAKTNYVQALYDYNTSNATLERAMGIPVLVG